VLHHRDIVVIGASAGGVKAALSLVEKLPKALPASLLIAIHIAPGHVSKLPELLTSMGGLHAAHALDGELLSPGKIYVSAPDVHLFVRPSGCLGVVRGVKENGHRPSVDMLFRTASARYGPRVIGVVLSGHLDCGSTGLLSIKARGGVAIAQDPHEAEVPSMPLSAIEVGHADHVASIERMAELIVRLTHETLPSVGDAQDTQSRRGQTLALSRVVAEQGESVERALWSAVRALEHAANLATRVAGNASAGLKQRLEEKSLDQKQQADIIRSILLTGGKLAVREGAFVVDELDSPRVEQN